jgi:hypothetical protein
MSAMRAVMKIKRGAIRKPTVFQVCALHAIAFKKCTV